MAEIDSSKTSLILIRHGKSLYTNKFPDLTDEGIRQITESAEILKPFIDMYDLVRAFSSSAFRALGSARVFLQAIGRGEEKVVEIEDLSPVKIIDFSKFLPAINRPNQKKEYEAFLTDPVFDDPNNGFSETRSEIRKRAFRFLLTYCDQQSADTSVNCSLVFAHFECMSGYLNALYDHPNPFPIDRADGPGNGEAIIFQPDKYHPRDLLIAARSKIAKIRLNPELGDFEKVE